MKTGDITIKKFKNYEFVCWYWATSRAWGHECRLCNVGEMAGIEIGKARVRYYNRTWEAYTFQSVMYEALGNYKKSELNRYLDNYKYSNGLKGYDHEKGVEYEKPFPKGVKKKLVEEFNNQARWEDIKNYIKRGE